MCEDNNITRIAYLHKGSEFGCILRFFPGNFGYILDLSRFECRAPESDWQTFFFAVLQILVLGGSGFVGTAVCKAALAQGISVVSLSR